MTSDNSDNSDIYASEDELLASYQLPPLDKVQDVRTKIKTENPNSLDVQFRIFKIKSYTAKQDEYSGTHVWLVDDNRNETAYRTRAEKLARLHDDHMQARLLRVTVFKNRLKEIVQWKVHDLVRLTVSRPC
ncbi:Aste57867_3095 [Aphanomyces stellatus]|uniref:Aste57867_3095 protein n=1 Tax=Aphanomyces stellatus TaxID=120398 RepID=A0A485KEQ6_9STRA|nr:hypothetical protein As57867_003086 [Aphanomyces stellatus]VFT80274.1 Aste57867_3095 [Aphanomyces stellatus]